MTTYSAPELCRMADAARLPRHITDPQTIVDAYAAMSRPACAFCGEPDATDVYREDEFPDAPCCADEDACHARVLAS